MPAARRNWTNTPSSAADISVGDRIRVEFRVNDISRNPDGTTTLRLETVERTPDQTPIPFVLITRDVNYSTTG